MSAELSSTTLAAHETTEPAATVISPLALKSKFSNALASLDHAHVQALHPRVKNAFELKSKMDDDALFLRDYLVGPQSILQMALRSESDYSLQDMFQPNALTQLPTLDLEVKLKALMARIRDSKLATLQCLKLAKNRSVAQGLSHPSSALMTGSSHASRTVESHLHYVTTSHIPDVSDRVEPVSEPELLLSVCIFQPNRPQLIKSQEFLMLGSNTLASLRDRIYCITDTILKEERQDQLPLESTATATTAAESSRSGSGSVPKDLSAVPISSGFFFIEKTFYADRRVSTDPTPGLLAWIRERATHPTSRYYGQGHAYTIHPESVEHVRWIDIPKLALNVSYLYTHTGGCEHVVTISQVRLFSSALYSSNALNYPLTTYHSKLRKRKCRICDIYGASFVTFDDRLAPENPCCFCKQCYEDFHYDEEGKLMYSDFEVYKYIHE